MRTIVAGGRDFNDRKLLEFALSGIGITSVVCGCARGADQMGELWAKRTGVGVVRFPADWNTHGKKAGFLRNLEMADNADCLVAFWNGVSRGTAHMIGCARRKNIQVIVVAYDVDPLI